MKALKEVMTYPLNIQLFAEGEEEPAPQADPEPKAPAKTTFNELLKDSEYQAEFDKKMDIALKKATENAVNKAKEAWENEISEAKRLEKLSADDRAKEVLAKQQKAIEDREKEVSKRELTAQAIKEMSEKGLPTDCVAFLVGDTAEVTKENIGSFEKSFSEAISKAVEKRIAENARTPGKGVSGGKEEPQGTTKFNIKVPPKG